MFANRVISSSSSVVKASVRGMSSASAGIAISGPPKNRMSFPTKVIYGLVMTTGACFYPAWVLGNIRSYKGQSE